MCLLESYAASVRLRQRESEWHFGHARQPGITQNAEINCAVLTNNTPESNEHLCGSEHGACSCCSLSSLSSTSRSRIDAAGATRGRKRRAASASDGRRVDGATTTGGVAGAARATHGCHGTARLPGALLLYCKHKGHRRLLRAQQGLCCVRAPDHDCFADGRKVASNNLRRPPRVGAHLGKRKRGAAEVAPDEKVLTIECDDGSEFCLRPGVRGRVLELGARLTRALTCIDARGLRRVDLAELGEGGRAAAWRGGTAPVTCH